MATAPAVSPQTRELASRIYVDLVVRATHVAESAVKMESSPVNIAKLSFKLAAEFDAVERELNAAHLPKNQDFKVDVESIANWSK